jgi:hypothetical protein
LDTYWKKEKGETKNKWKKGVLIAMEECDLRDGEWETDFFGDWVMKEVAIRHKTTTYIYNEL